MAEESFTIIYDGRSLRSGRINVRDLAPSLIGLANGISVASQVLHPDKAEPALEIKANNEGSFEVDLVLNGIQDVRNAWPVVQDYILRPQFQAMAELTGLVMAVLAAINFIAKRAGKKIQTSETLNPGEVRITFEDGSQLDLPADSLTIAENVIFRKAAKAIVAPMAGAAIEEIKFRHRSNPEIVIKAEDVDSYEFSSERSLVDDSISIMILKAVSITFARENKWRFTTGDYTFFAKIEDEIFLNKIHSNSENFVANDIYRCRVQTKTWQGDDGSLQPERIILEVLEHRAGMIQSVFDEIED